MEKKLKLKTPQKIPELKNLQIFFNEIQICDTKKFTENLNLCIILFDKQVSLDIFLKILHPILLCKKTPIPPKIVLFLKRLIEEISKTESGKTFILKLFEHLFNLLNSKTTRVRKNSIFFIRLFSSLGDLNSKISKDILEKISERLFDKKKVVRKEAILFLQNFQNYDLNESTKIVNLLKNVCKYDPSTECRKLAYENLEVNIFTINCIVDRCSDVNLGIRTIFYKKFLEKINIRELRHDKKIFLLKKVFTEREIDSIALFVNSCILYYDLPLEFNLLVLDFYNLSTCKLLQKLLTELFSLLDFEICGEKAFENLTFENLFFYFNYLENTLEKKGRDNLNLLPLSRYVNIMYKFIKSSEENNEKLETSKFFFKILKFYDVFDDESKKIINSTIYKLIKNGVHEEIIEEVVKILYKIDKQNGDKMFGALIHKHIDNNLIYTLQIAKFLLKYSNSIENIQEAIANELILKFYGEDTDFDNLIAEAAFFYLNLVYDEKVFEYFTNFKKKVLNFFAMISDLAIKFDNVNYFELANETFFDLLEKNDLTVLVPGSKLILSNKVTDESLIFKYFKFALTFYFQEEDDKIQQYLNVLFHEYFIEDSSILIRAFCPVYEILDQSEKSFVDQCLYLIENSKKQNGTQLLFYNICVNFYLFYSNGKLIKKFLYVLNKINIVGAWNSMLTKRILFSCTHIMKKPGMIKKFTNIVNSLMAIDDGEPISQEDLKIVKDDLCIS